MGAPADPVVSIDLVREERMVRERRLDRTLDLRIAKLVADLSRHPDLGDRPRAALAIRAAQMVMPGHDLTPLLPVVKVCSTCLSEYLDLLSRTSETPSMLPTTLAAFRLMPTR